ncbi:MAG: AarF/ABC1/UbiB kinase family protein [Myxococcales bacterium]|jgi:ubiquinone biosynthesis protein|nr:AarF/ABC1/UbiB kinase family protein [Myxococcales bacterium]
MLSVVSAVRDLARLREITAVLARHGFGEIVARAGLGRAQKPKGGDSEPPPSGRKPDSMAPPEIDTAELERGEEAKRTTSTPERIRLVLQDLGPSFIKLGQIASTRPDLLPADVIAEIKKLQDDVPPIPFADIKKAVETSLGAPLSKIYKSFDEKPLATASIGQVHRAVLATPEGDREVVVKVQRPGVSETVLRDVELLHMMAQAIERAIPESKLYNPVALVQQFDRSITSELNFLVEGENGERFAKNFEKSTVVRFPKGYKQASSKHVLTLEFFDGKKVDKAVAAGWDGKVIAKQSVGVVIKMIFEDGFFHADPHPGNIIILGPPKQPVIGLIDLGMVGRLSPELRERTIDLMIAAARKDSYGVADALYAIGKPTKKVDMREYRAEVALLAEKYLGRPLKEIELSGLIRDLVQGAMKYGIEIPPDFMMVGKSLMTIEGIGKQLDPDLDVLGEASPYFTDLVKKRYSPERLGNELMRGVEQLSRAGYDVPIQLREVLDDVRMGRLVVRTVNPAIEVAADRLGRRVFAGLVSAALLGSGAALLREDDRSSVGIALLVIGAVVVIGHVLADARRFRPKKED